MGIISWLFPIPKGIEYEVLLRDGTSMRVFAEKEPDYRSLWQTSAGVINTDSLVVATRISKL